MKSYFLEEITEDLGRVRSELSDLLPVQTASYRSNLSATNILMAPNTKNATSPHRLGIDPSEQYQSLRAASFH